MDEGLRTEVPAAGRERLELAGAGEATATPGDPGIALELRVVPVLDPERAIPVAPRPVPDAAARPAMLLPAGVRAPNETALDEPEMGARWEAVRTLPSEPFEPADG